MSIDTGLSLTYRANFPVPDINQSSQPFRDNFSVLQQAIENLQSMSSTANSAIAVSPVLSSSNGAFNLELTFANNSLTLPIGDPSNVSYVEGMIKYDEGHLYFFDGTDWRSLYSNADRLPGFFAHLEVSDGAGNTAMIADYANGVTISDLMVTEVLTVPMTQRGNSVVLPTSNGTIAYSATDGTWYFGSNGSSDGFKVNHMSATTISITSSPSEDTDAATVGYVTTALEGFTPNVSGIFNSPNFTGTPTAPTPILDDASNAVATTAFVMGQDYLTNAAASALYASIASPVFTGSPVVPTPNASDTSNTVATTAFVKSLGYVTKSEALANATLTGTVTAPTPSGSDNSAAVATTAFVAAQGFIKASTVSSTYSTLNSPIFSGTPAAPTPSGNDVSTRIATTEWVSQKGFLTIADAHSKAGVAVRMAADTNYQAGTVVVLGGSAEITASSMASDPRVAGVVVTGAASMYFDGVLSPSNSNNLLIAASGRAFVKVVGPVSPGDMLVTSSTPGYAEPNSSPSIGTVIGKAIGSVPSGEGIVEIVIMPC